MRTRLGEAKEAIRNNVKKNTDSNNEMSILSVQENNRINNRIEGKRIKKVLNLNKETIKVLRLMEERFKKYCV